MNSALPAAAPGFDQPIAVLKHCHDKIRQQVATLNKLPDELAQHGATIEAQQAASAVLKYFDKAAHIHHEDEENDLMPMLQATASGADAIELASLVPTILADHRAMDAAWEELKVPLQTISRGGSAALSADQVSRFTNAYQAHMAKEEAHLAPMAKRLFSAEQMAALGLAMRLRRGLGEPAAADAAPATTAAPAAPATSAASTSPTGSANSATAPSGAVPTGPTTSLADLRTDYSQASLLETDVLDDPIAQFGLWFEQALQAEVREPNAMSVATVDASGQPSSRIVLIKQFDQRGFTWYTNYASQKGVELASNNRAALLFFWSELERQVRIEGTVIKTSAAESDHYFDSRPLLSRLAAIASAQSAPIANRELLEENFKVIAEANGAHPPRPPHWGGYRLQPTRFEFWQGRRSRFHDRIVFTLQADGNWLRQRLQP